jgi:gamma-glutamyltranspeptidase/glutathione hydrolase
LSPRSRETEETELLELSGDGAVRPQRHAFSRAGMVSTQHYRATQAGVSMLRQGGNAVDAAVAAAFALGVCEPQASGLGGQTMMLVHIAEPRELLALDGSSRAPNRAAPESLRRSQRRRGHAATTVPSTPATLTYALKTYGSMSLEQVLQPAIELATDGFLVSELLHALTKRELKHLKARNAGAVFLRNATRPHPVGTTLRQPALADTLRRLAHEGIEDFYVGAIAQRIHADMQENGGLLHADDLAQIPWPIARRPVASRFAGMRVVTFPPPGAGRVLLEMLHVMEEFPRRLWTPDTPRGALLLAEVIQRAALDRQDRPFDPEFYPQVTERRMLSRDYARRTAKRIRKRMRTHGETTHLSVMDQQGNAVALTQSIERVFGSFTMAPDLGFLYNNYMTAFEFEDIGHPYYMRPNAVPWASVAPTMVFRGPKPWLALGSPGSERIVSSVLQVFLRLLETSPYNAVASPRIHCSDAGKVSLEISRFRDDIPRLLERKGFVIDARDPFSFYMGCVQLVVRERRGFTGVADPRRDGSAGGPET